MPGVRNAASPGSLATAGGGSGKISTMTWELVLGRGGSETCPLRSDCAEGFQEISESLRVTPQAGCEPCSPKCVLFKVAQVALRPRPEPGSSRPVLGMPLAEGCCRFFFVIPGLGWSLVCPKEVRVHNSGQLHRGQEL